MLGASFLPARLRHEHNNGAPANPGYINRQITRLLQTVSRSAFTYPIHTIVFVALLASTSYMGLLQGSLFDHTSLGTGSGSTDLNSLVEGSRRLRLGEETSWKWQADNGVAEDAATVRKRLKMEQLDLIDRAPGCLPCDGHDIGLSRLTFEHLPADCSPWPRGIYTQKQLYKAITYDLEPSFANLARYNSSICGAM